MPPSGPIQYWLGPYRRVDDDGIGDAFDAPPVGAIASLDLRYSTLGAGFFCLPDGVDPGAGYVAIGDSLGGASERSKWQDATAIDADGDTVLDRLVSSLTDQSDPMGAAGPYPLMPDSRGRLEIHLQGHSVIWAEKYSPQHRHAPKVEGRVRGVFDSIDPKMRGKFISAVRSKYGLSEREALDRLVPKPTPSPKPQRPDTTITDDFNRADSASLGANWTEYGTGSGLSIASNECVSLGNAQTAAHNTALSSDDMYAQVEIRNTPAELGLGTNPASIVRFTPSAGNNGTGYETLPNINSPTASIRLFRGTGTGLTLIGSDSTLAVDTGQVIRTTADGSTISSQQNGTTRVSVTNTVVVSVLVAGIRLNDGGKLDNFEAADIVAAGGPFPHYIRRSNAMTGGFAA